jgi:hypothetical protein
VSASSAPGYRSWAWTQQDWRVVVPLPEGKLDYSERCGGPANRTPSGHVRLCLPLAVLSQLAATSEGTAILHRQAVSKQRAPVGTRVPWHPRIAALWRELEDRTPEDRSNPGGSPMLDKTTTPGTRLVWDDLAGWLASMDELVRRPPAAKTYRDTKAHLALLTPAVLATAQSVYELDIAEHYVRGALPPKGQRAGHPMTALLDAVDRTRTAFVHPRGSKSARVTLSQRSGAAAEPFVSPMDALTQYVRAEPRMVSLGAHWWRLPYALERHPYLVVPLYVQAALPTLPAAPPGRRWVIDPTDETGATIRLVSARTGRIEASTPEVSFIWFHSPHPWAWRGGPGSSPGHATAREAAERLLVELGLHAVPAPTPRPELRIVWRLVGPHVAGSAAQFYVKEGNARRVAEKVPPPVDLEKVEAKLTMRGGFGEWELVNILDRSILHRGTSPAPPPAPAFGEINSVQIYFQTIDEWHDTTMIVVAVLPREWLQQSDGAKIAWVNERWTEIKAKLPPYRTPPPASDQSGRGYYDWDEDEDGDDEGDTTDYPEPGLGWIDPGMMLALDKFGLVLHAKEGPGSNVITITLNWSER